MSKSEPKGISEQFREAVRQYLEGSSARKLATLSGVSHVCIYGIVQGRHSPSLRVTERVALAIGKRVMIS